jgi:cysteine desulfurase/selenocysteine lyase
MRTAPIASPPAEAGAPAASPAAALEPSAALQGPATPGEASPQPLPAGSRRPAPAYDLARVRADFPILATRVHGRPLAYLDNAASMQKPRAVMEAVVGCWSTSYSNVGRSVHTLARRAAEAREAARGTVARFLGAPSPDEIVFVRGTTEAINLVAASFGRRRVGRGDEVIATALEHHSNLVPWQRLCAERGARLRIAPLDERGRVAVDGVASLLGPRTRIVALSHVSNVLGTVSPVAEIAALAHRRGAAVVVDGAQAVPHLAIDVGRLGCDFYAFSGHKVYGPSGIGVLWGRAELLAEMPPWQLGGGMVETVGYEEATFAPPPQRFEAGTPAIEGAVGLAAALDYLLALGLAPVAAWEHELLVQATARLLEVPGLRLVGSADPRSEKASVVSFVLDGAHAHDVATILDAEGVAVRAGHHCAQPLMARLGLTATTRASFACYNTLEEVDALAAGLHRVREVLG